MATLDPNKNRVTPFRVPREGVAGWRKLYEVLGFILRRMGFKLSLDGVDGQEIAGGLHLRVDKATGSGAPFYVSTSGLVTPGTFHGTVPTIGGVLITSATPTRLGIATTGPTVAYIRIAATLTAAHDYVSSYVFTSVTIASAAVIPADDKAAGIYYRPLAYFSDGAKTMQAVTSSLDGFLEDDGTATSKADLYIFQS